MKKIFTLFVFLGTFTLGFAQSGDNEAKRVILGRKKTDGGAPGSKDVVLGGDSRNDSKTYPDYPSTNSRDQQVYEINREYDAKIESVRNNRYLSAAEKERAIRDLNADRAKRIRNIDRSSDSNRNEKDRKAKKKVKGNNGNHYGWEKGKENPHKAGGKNKGYKKD